MKLKLAILVLFSLTIFFFTGCTDTEDDSSSGSLEVTGPVSGDNTSETKVYNSGDSFDFGNILDGTDTNKTADFTIKNNSDETVSLTGSSPVTISSGDSVYIIEGDQPDASIAAGEEVGFTLAFQDNSSAGTEEGVLTIASDNEEFGTFTLDITGTIVEPGEIEIWGPTDRFDATPLKYDSGDEFYTANYENVYTFTIKNVGNGTLSLTEYPLELSGTDPTWFIITEQPGSATIATGTEATFKFRFDVIASEYVDKYANIEINSDDPDMESFTLALRGLAS